MWDTMVFDFHLRLAHVYFLTLCSALEIGFIHLYYLPPAIHPLLFSTITSPHREVLVLNPVSSTQRS